jgi:hypothetical protein
LLCHSNGATPVVQALASLEWHEAAHSQERHRMSMFNRVSKTFTWGQHTVTLETGEIARQSSGAVIVNIDDTVVLATVVAKTDAKAGQDFFPLTVD